MAVRALPRPRPSATSPLVTASLPAGVLLLALAAPALDLLAMVQPIVAGLHLALFASVVSGVVLLAAYVKFPRTSWLAAAALAACAGAALRLLGADLAPALSLLAVIALGVGGAFASQAGSAEALLA